MTRLLALVLAWCATLGAAAAEPAPPPDAPLPQVLVMLHLPSAHFRADATYSGAYAASVGSAARDRLARSLARAHGLSVATHWPMPLLGLDCYVMDVPAPRAPDDVADQLGRDPRVAWAQPMHEFRPSGHADPLFNLQPAAGAWQLDALHGVSTGRDVKVAVVDSGVQLDHPDLIGQVTSSVDVTGAPSQDGEVHGTAVAGIIAARADNGVGIVGVAPQAGLLAYRACRQSAADTRCDTLSLARALHAAIQDGAQIVNLSLGGPSDRLIRRLVETALSRGIELVAAADRAVPGGGFPAAVPGVVAVSESPLVIAGAAWVAPGTDIPTTVPVSRWSTVSGASFAAAHVSGLLALMLAIRAPQGRPRTPLADDLVRQEGGRIDACASLFRAGGRCACHCDGVSPMAAVAPR